MRNYIDLLTDRELQYCCKRIGGRTLRDLYQKNVNSFNKYKPGYRPGHLLDEEAYNFACANRKVSFVADFLNFVIATWLQQISEFQEKTIRDGKPESIALIETLAQSVFDEQPEIYFKVSGTRALVEPEEVLYHAIKVTCERNRLSSAEVGADRLDGELDRLREQHEAEMQARKQEFETALDHAEREVERLKNTIEQDRVKIEGLVSSGILLEEELRSYRELSASTDEKENLGPNPEYDYASLCVAFKDTQGRDRILRVADVRNNVFSDVFIESAPDYKRLYNIDGPNQEGTVGVWDWRVIPNRNDPNKDFIESAFNRGIKPVEVIFPEDCQNLSDLVERLKSGISINQHTERMLLAVSNDGNNIGIMCEAKDFRNKQGFLSINDSVLKLPVYSFSMSNILHVERTVVLDRINLGMPKELIRIKDPMEVVKECIVAKATWPVSQQRGFVRNEYRQIRAFLNELQTSDLYEEISLKCECSIEEAVGYVSSFMARADKVVIGNTIENDVMAQIIRNDPNAYSECMSKLKQEWEQENQSMLLEAQASLEEVKREVAEYSISVLKKQEELSALQEKVTEADLDIEKQRELADEVEKIVAGQIEHARNNVAEFIAHDAFAQAYGKLFTGMTSVEQERSSKVQQLFSAHSSINAKEPDVNETYEDLIQTTQFELTQAGVDDENAPGVAALLYSAYIRKIPILFAGPNGSDIADAFSVALNCQTAARLDCRGTETDTLDNLTSSDEQIIVIDNPLQANWESYVIRQISKRDKFYILTIPFSEDLVLEPRSLFNYCVPVITELFVSSSPSQNYTGGEMAAGFRHYKPEGIIKSYDKILDALKINSLARENIQALISDLNMLMNNKIPEAILQLLLYPVSVATGNTHVLAEKMELMDRKPSAQFISRIKRLIGEEE